jgi:hypothetical protein
VDDMKICANITAITVNDICMPIELKNFPMMPSLPNAIKRAIPATAGGKTAGMSTRYSANVDIFPFLNAIQYARGVPNKNVMTTVTLDDMILRSSALIAGQDVISATIIFKGVLIISEIKGINKKKLKLM